MPLIEELSLMPVLRRTGNISTFGSIPLFYILPFDDGGCVPELEINSRLLKLVSVKDKRFKWNPHMVQKKFNRYEKYRKIPKHKNFKTPKKNKKFGYKY